MKGHYNLSLDQDVWEQFQKLYPNQASTKVNEYLASVVNASKRNVCAINVAIERLKLDEEIKQLNKIQSSINNRTEQIKKWDEEQKKKQAEDLEKQKKEIEEQESCVSCGKIIVGKSLVWKDDKRICHSCFMDGRVPR